MSINEWTWMENMENKIKHVRNLVEASFRKQSDHNGLSELTDSEKEHIINIGTSILCTKWGVGYEGGGFVRAFVDNDLMNAIGRADATTYKGFKFFAALVYNTAYPAELIG